CPSVHWHAPPTRHRSSQWFASLPPLDSPDTKNEHHMMHLMHAMSPLRPPGFPFVVELVGPPAVPRTGHPGLWWVVDTGCARGAENKPVEPDLVRTSEGMSQVTLAQLSPVPRVLSIAGTDPSGGAGTAADMKSITAAGGYAMAAVTALVAQNTHGVRDVHMPPADFLTTQLQAVSDDVTLEAVKTGMLGNGEVITAVSQWLTEHHRGVLVVDPVMVATSGHRLLDEDAEQQMVQFCRLATVVTPNIDELALLTGSGRATDETEALEQATGWARETGVSVVVKTGHLGSPLVTNTWVHPDGTTIPIPTARVDTTNTHGTGCSLAAALATRLGRGHSPQQALQWSTSWLHEAIASAAQLQVGSGNGPVDHAHRSRRLAEAASSQPWLPAGAVPEALSRPEDLGRRDQAQEHAAQHHPAQHGSTQPHPAHAAVPPAV